MIAPTFRIEEVHDLDAAWPELRALFLAFEAYNADFLSRRLRDDWEQRWRESLAMSADRLVLVARVAGAAAGYLVAHFVRGRGLFEEMFGEVSDLFVLPEFRGRVIGRALLRRAEVWCRERGANEVRLDVYAANKRGVRFWTLSGYRLEGMAMSKRLDGPA